MKTTTKMVFEIEKELQQELKIAAIKSGISMKQILTDCVTEWINKNKK